MSSDKTLLHIVPIKRSRERSDMCHKHDDFAARILLSHTMMRRNGASACAMRGATFCTGKCCEHAVVKRVASKVVITTKRAHAECVGNSGYPKMYFCARPGRTGTCITCPLQ